MPAAHSEPAAPPPQRHGRQSAATGISFASTARAMRDPRRGVRCGHARQRGPRGIRHVDGFGQLKQPPERRIECGIGGEAAAVERRHRMLAGALAFARRPEDRRPEAHPAIGAGKMKCPTESAERAPARAARPAPESVPLWPGTMSTDREAARMAAQQPRRSAPRRAAASPPYSSNDLTNPPGHVQLAELG